VWIWTGHEIVDDSTIRIFFTGSDPKCFGAKTMIEESQSEIRIAIIIGSIPEASETCHTLGVLNAMTVETAEKINGRNIVRWDNPGLRPETPTEGPSRKHSYAAESCNFSDPTCRPVSRCFAGHGTIFPLD